MKKLTTIFLRKISFIYLVLFGLIIHINVNGQTTSENFILTKNYKQPSTVSITNPSPQQAIQTINYFDGLGRPILKIDNQQSASGNNIVTPYEYDSFGRSVKEYLPYPTQSTSLNFIPVNTAISNQSTFIDYQNQIAFSEKQFENSPLNRVLKQAAPGNDWAMGSGHEIKMDYQTNSINEVKLFQVEAVYNSSTGLFDTNFTQTGTSFYPANQLYKTVTKDENWVSGTNNTVEEFKDKFGRVILKRTYNNGALDTYYIYDQYGNLSFVLPPAAEGNITPTKLEGLCYQYKYDYRNRLAEKKIPGKQWEFIVYDRLDRVVATGPALSPFTDAAIDTYGWMITKYDALNRPVLTAWMQETFTTSSRVNLQNNFTNATVLNVIKSTTDTSINGVSFRYSNTVFPTAGYHVLTVNYYDDYTTNITFNPAINLTAAVQPAPTCYTNIAGSTPKGLATVSWTRVLQGVGQINAETSYTVYDVKGNVVRTFKNNYLGGFTQIDNQLELMTGRINYSITTHKRLSSSTILTLRDDFTYTNQDRLLAQIHKINSLPGQLIIKNEYDELGKLKSKRVGGTDIVNFTGLQKVDYSYNIRGWLTDINDVNNLTKPSDPRDLFAFKVNYNSVQNSSYSNANALFNGNISETLWRTDKDDVKRKYGYKYDALSRLTDSYYQKPDIAQQANSYGEFLTYDKNGNILSLQRNGEMDDDINVIQIDNLSYNYLSDSNQLSKVTDITNSNSGFLDVNTPNPDYTYDLNGNLKSDLNKSISSIKYNHLNLPTEIIFSGSTPRKINYLYNSLGVKVKKVVTNNTSITNIDYLDGFQYRQIGTGTVYMEFFPHSEGYVSVTTSGTNSTYNYVYNYQDHLGNNRLSYTFDNTLNALTILEENHYYPFGLKHNNYNMDQEYFDNTNGIITVKPKVIPYKYKYNGKEYQDELGLNFYDYGARNYDAALGRWMNIDPLSEKYFDSSPYAYVCNDPVNYIDPDGMDRYYMNDKGRTVLALKEDGDDMLFIGGKDNKSIVDTNKDGKQDSKDGITVKTEGLLQQLTQQKGTKTSLYTSTVEQSETAEDDMLNIFHFAANNTKVEFSLNFYDKDGKSQISLGTFNSEWSSPGMNTYGKVKANKAYHNHPSDDTYSATYTEKNSMGYNGENQGLGGDSRNAVNGKKTYPNYVFFPKSTNLYNVTQYGIDLVKKINGNYKNLKK